MPNCNYFCTNLIHAETAQWGLIREKEVAQLCLTLRDNMDCSLPGSSIHGIFQARALEWGAIALSESHLEIGHAGV